MQLLWRESHALLLTYVAQVPERYLRAFTSELSEQYPVADSTLLQYRQLPGESMYLLKGHIGGGYGGGEGGGGE